MKPCTKSFLPILGYGLIDQPHKTFWDNGVDTKIEHADVRGKAQVYIYWRNMNIWYLEIWNKALITIAERGSILIVLQIQGNVQSNNSTTDSELRKAFPNHSVILSLYHRTTLLSASLFMNRRGWFKCRCFSSKHRTAFLNILYITRFTVNVVYKNQDVLWTFHMFWFVCRTFCTEYTETETAPAL